MDFGKTFTNTVRPLGIFFGVFVLLFLIIYIIGNVSGSGNLQGLNFSLIVGVLLAWLVAIVFLFLSTVISLHVTDQIVQIRLFKKFVLREERIVSLHSVEILSQGGVTEPNGIILKFCNAQRIRMFFHSSEVKRVSEYIREVTNNRVQVEESE
jgi:hypothetical protein